MNQIRPQSLLPATPAEGLDISPDFRAEMEAVFAEAESTGDWKRPWDAGATLYEEMEAVDKFYWVYKCQNPVTLPEAGVDIDAVINRDGSILSLPEGFDAETSVTLGAGGDMFRVEGLENSHDHVFANIADLLFDQDFSMANLESPVTKQALEEEVISDKESPTECSSQLHFDALKGHQGKTWTALHLANNHINDMGVEGLETTAEALSAAGIQSLGVNGSEEDFGRPVIFTIKGIKIGMVTTTFGLNGRDLAEGDEHRIHVSNMLSKYQAPECDLVKRQIDACRAEGCDFIIASIHGGYEFEFFPRKRQIDMAHDLIEYGADAIIGHHPHVIQPVDYYRTKRDPNRVAVIAYSLGSLLWSFSAPHLALSLILNFKMTKGSHQGKSVTYLEEASATPVFRRGIKDDATLVSTVEKLSDHLNNPASPFDSDYLEQIGDYVDLALGT